MTFVFFKLRFKSHCLQYFYKKLYFFLLPILSSREYCEIAYEEKGKYLCVKELQRFTFFRLCITFL